MQVGKECRGRMVEHARIRRIGGRPRGVVSKPRGERVTRALDRAVLLDDAVLRGHAGAAQRERVGRVLPARGDRGRHRVELQLQLSHELDERRARLLREIQLEPGKRDLAPQPGTLCVEVRGFHVALQGGALPAQPPLLPVGKVLHDADLAHRHEVAVVAEPVRAVHGQVVHADAKLGVGQFSRARHELGRGGERRALRGKTRGNLFAYLQRFGEWKRVRTGRVREGRGEGKTDTRETSERARETPGQSENHKASDEQGHRRRQRRHRGSAAAK